ncbi:MAG: sulfatase family protein [Planctomycetota bacterium]|jgi:arylsulfatase A-like enzyme
MGRPHVVLVICDQMQYMRQGRVDPVAHTPSIDRLADDGVFFTHAFSASGQCVPSRASIQTGLYPHEVEVMANYGMHDHTAHLTEEHRTVGHVFRDAGYTTAYFGKMHLGVPLDELGYDHGGGIVTRRKPGRRGDLRIHAAALDFIARHDPARPLFLTLSLHMPHRNFRLVDEFKAHYPLKKLEVPDTFHLEDLSGKPPFFVEHARDPRFRYRREKDLKRELRCYYSMISEIDRLFGELRAALEARGMWDDAVVAFTSDHGDMMGSFRLMKKGTMPYDPIYRIPLVMRVPHETFPRSTVDDLVVNVSLPGTLVEAAGLAPAPELRGGSLLPALRATGPPDDERIFYEHYAARWGVHPFRAVRTREWKYAKYYGPDDTEELYHLAADPGETRNRAGDAAAKAVRAELEEAVDRWWAETGGRDFAYYESTEFKAKGGVIRVIPRE